MCRSGLSDELQRMVLHDNFGQTTNIRFSEVQRNQQLDPALFRFEVPDGVEVVGETRRDRSATCNVEDYAYGCFATATGFSPAGRSHATADLGRIRRSTAYPGPGQAAAAGTRSRPPAFDVFLGPARHGQDHPGAVAWRSRGRAIPETFRRCWPGSRRSARRWNSASNRRGQHGAAQFCSSMKFIASTSRSRMPFCPTWKTARLFLSAPPRRTLPSS